LCGSPAYLGFLEVACSEEGCRHHKPGVLEPEAYDEARANAEAEAMQMEFEWCDDDPGGLRDD